MDFIALSAMATICLGVLKELISLFKENISYERELLNRTNSSNSDKYIKISKRKLRLIGILMAISIASPLYLNIGAKPQVEKSTKSDPIARKKNDSLKEKKSEPIKEDTLNRQSKKDSITKTEKSINPDIQKKNSPKTETFKNSIPDKSQGKTSEKEKAETSSKNKVPEAITKSKNEFPNNTINELNSNNKKEKLEALCWTLKFGIENKNTYAFSLFENFAAENRKLLESERAKEYLDTQTLNAVGLIYSQIDNNTKEYTKFKLNVLETKKEYSTEIK